MTLVHEPERMSSQENRVPERNGWFGEYLVEMLGISGQKEEGKLNVFISLGKS